MIGRRESAIALLVGVLAVAALAGVYGDPAPEALGDGTGSSPEVTTPVEVESQSSSPPVVPPSWTIRAVVVATAGFGTVFVAVAAIAVLWLRGVDGLKRILRLVGEMLAGTGLFVLMALVVLGIIIASSSAGIEPTSLPTGEAPTESTGGGGGETSETDATFQPWLLGAGVLGALALAAAAVVRYVWDGSGSTFTVEDATDDPAHADRDAGGPIDPPEPVADVPPSNGVYRAWRRLADAVDETTDRTLTTGEVAAVAVERGLDGEAVRTLTRQFEEVRYGGRSATDERERRAEEALAGLALDGGEEA